MELKDFVSESLTQIMSGVIEAQQTMNENQWGGEISPQIKTNWEKTGLVFSQSGMPVQSVEFDVAVTASKGTDTKGTIGIVVAAIGLGSQGETHKNDTNNSRIKFSVSITLPIMSKKES